MILSKFRPVSLFGRVKILSVQLLVLCVLSCNKTANINKNKAYLSLTNVAYGSGPLNIAINNQNVFSSFVGFGQNSSITGSLYDTTTSRITNMTVVPDPDSLFTGFASFRLGAYYSIFIFDTLDTKTMTLLILQDAPPAPTDTTTSIRFLNFSPSSLFSVNTYLGLKLVNTIDTVVIPPQYFVGYNPDPNAYYFTSPTIHYGNYAVYVYADSSAPRIDSLNVHNDSTNFRKVDSLQINYLKNYNVYLQGFFETTNEADTLKLVSVQLN
jgi:hypothetical protein